MKVARFLDQGRARVGVVDDGHLRAATGDLVGGLTADGAPVPLDDVHLLAPCEPTKIVCIGRNYAAHIEEMGRPWPEQPFMFLKAPNTVIGPGDAVRRPAGVDQFHFEGELAIVVGRRARAIAADAWPDHVAGFTCANDLTVREWQENDGQWARAKSADTFCPLGPWIETEIADPHALKLQTRVNGDVRQDSTTADFVFGIGDLLEFITAAITLEPGDVVLTGTPGGVGDVDEGDVVEVDIEGIGVLRNPIATAS